MGTVMMHTVAVMGMMHTAEVGMTLMAEVMVADMGTIPTAEDMAMVEVVTATVEVMARGMAVDMEVTKVMVAAMENQRKRKKVAVAATGIINMRKLILASSSPRRREILEKIGVPFRVEVGDYEEDMSIKLKPEELVKKFAIGKARSVAIKHADAVIIGADTVISHNGKVIGKPYTVERTIEVLSKLSGASHSVHTGYCIIDTATGKKSVGTVATKVFFRKLSRAEIQAYAATGEGLHAAGGYMVQGRAASFVTRIEGDYFNIVGFPLSRIVPELKKRGITAF